MASALTAGILDNIIRKGRKLFRKAATEGLEETAERTAREIVGETAEKATQEAAEETAEKIEKNLDDAGDVVNGGKDSSDVIRDNLVNNIKNIRNQIPNTNLSKRGNMAAGVYECLDVIHD